MSQMSKIIVKNNIIIFFLFLYQQLYEIEGYFSLFFFTIVEMKIIFSLSTINKHRFISFAHTYIFANEKDKREIFLRICNYAKSDI